MNSLQQHIQDKYSGSWNWFKAECESGLNTTRIMDVLDKKDYLVGNHAIINRPNDVFNVSDK